MRPTLWLLWAVSLEPETEHLSQSREKIKNTWSFNFVAHCAFITILWHWWLLEFILKLKECVQCCCASMLTNLHQVLKKEAVSWCKILKISLCCVWFVQSWVQGKGTQYNDLEQMWCLHGASDALQKVIFKNKLSFHSFYIFLNFTFILIGPLRKVKSGFHCVSLLASGWLGTGVGKVIKL